MATRKKPAAQTEDNYQLPSVNPVLVEEEAPKLEPQQPAGSLEEALAAAVKLDAQTGTIAFELNYCIERFKANPGLRDETRYRLECLAADASDAEVEKIARILAAM